MKAFHLVLAHNKYLNSFFCRYIQTNAVLSARKIKSKPRKIPYEPGLRHRQAGYNVSSQFLEDIDDADDLEEDLDIMKRDKILNEGFREEKIRKSRINFNIIQDKFFKVEPDPVTLTWDEREYLKKLHESDPTHWTPEVLSEYFPATQYTIAKILRSKHTVSENKKKKIEEKVKRNWELLEQGKLDADPKSIEHFQKFINKRDIILKKIKDEIILPNVKKEPVWNQGIFNKILLKYERDLEKLEAKRKEKKMVTDGLKDVQSKQEVIQKKINQALEKVNVEEKDSFWLGSMFKSYSREMTYQELESEVENKAKAQKKLSLQEKAILETKSNEKTVESTENGSGYYFKSKSESLHDDRIRRFKSNDFNDLQGFGSFKNTISEGDGEKDTESIDDTTLKTVVRRRIRKFRRNMPENLDEDDSKIIGESNSRALGRDNFKNFDEGSTHLLENAPRNPLKSFSKPRTKPESEMSNDDENFATNPSEVGGKTLLIGEEDVGKVLNDLQSFVKPVEEIKEVVEVSPREIEQWTEYCNNHAKDIENTSFWQDNRTSSEKALAESQKLPIPGVKGIPMTQLFSSEAYPDKIKIPKNKRGSGLIFKVKDCYYDDDGEFLYRVPGMVN